MSTCLLDFDSSPESEGSKHHQLPINPSNSYDADPPKEPNETTTNEVRARRPNWARSRSTTLNNSITALNNNHNRRRLSNLLRSVSMRSSYTFGRRATAPPEHFNLFGGEGSHPISSAVLEGRNTESNNGRDKNKTKEKGGFIRRWSLDSNDDPRVAASELSHYQEVFQHMKLQNPTASLGALQQKTMKRMSELKVEKEEMERMNLQRLRESECSARHGSSIGSNQGGNGRMTLLGSLFHHRPRAGSDLSDRNSSGVLSCDQSDHDNNKHHKQQGITPKASRSFRSNASIDSSHSHRGVLSRATILISQSLSSNNNQESTSTGEYPSPSLRRSSIESAPSLEADGSTESGGGVPIILKTSMILMGEDQKGNLAPRKSVGDLTAIIAEYDDDESDDDNDFIFEIDRSNSSGLYISGDDESQASGLYTSEGEGNAVVVHKGMESDLSDRGEEDEYVELEVLEMRMQQLDTSHRSHPRCGGEMSTNTFHSFVSEISNLTMMTEGSSHTDGSGSLIVGFGKQRVEKEDVSRGFAADFSAWDERSQQF